MDAAPQSSSRNSCAPTRRDPRRLPTNAAAAPTDSYLQTGPEPLHIKVSVPVGDGPGEMDELPKEFKESDVVIHLPNGAKVGEGGKVAIDGTLSVIPEMKNPSDGGTLPKTCYVKVEWASAG